MLSSATCPLYRDIPTCQVLRVRRLRCRRPLRWEACCIFAAPAVLAALLRPRCERDALQVKLDDGWPESVEEQGLLFSMETPYYKTIY